MSFARLYPALLLALLLLPACTGKNATDPSVTPASIVCDEGNGGLTLPDGFCAVVVADSIGRARHLVVAENGDIYVALRNMKMGGGIAALRDSTGDGKADRIVYFSAAPGTGIDIHNGYLYFAPDTAVVRYRMTAGSLLPADTTAEVVVSGFLKEGPHLPKPFTFDPSGHLYVNVGSKTNNCEMEGGEGKPQGEDPCAELERFAGIWQFSADSLGQTQTRGKRYVKGFRNAMALDWNPDANALFAVQHGRDFFAQNFPELYNNEMSAELPAEEFTQLVEGRDYGWPYCYYDQLQRKKVLAPEYGGDMKATGRCTAEMDPTLAFPGHYSPNDLIFYRGGSFPASHRGGAFIAFHGSWNRAPLDQKGYNVVFVPFSGGKPAGEWQVFADGFAGAAKVAGPGDARHRPTGLAIGPDGSLYVSDSVKGKIWRIIYRGA